MSSVPVVYVRRSVPEDIRSLKNLETLDMRMNDIEGPLPKAMSLLPRLSRLNISDNRISDISMSHLPVMTSLYCSNNKLETLELHEGPLRVLMARENCEYLCAILAYAFCISICYTYVYVILYIVCVVCMQNCV